jgi:mannose-1-phosphate guanylyltransferase
MHKEDGKPLEQLKALVLAAGFGTRLRPLTTTVPKPLATVCGVTLFDAAVRLCISAGALDVAVNTHHLPEVMANYALKNGPALGAQSVYISHEKTILGTGGALVAIEKWWGEASLLVYNGDILADLDLAGLAKAHAKGQNLVTLAVHDSPPTDGGRSVWVDGQGHVKCIATVADLPPGLDQKKLSQHGFACAYVASPRLRDFLPKAPEFYDLILAFNNALAAGQIIEACRHSGFWADIGNPKSLWETNLQVQKMNPQSRTKILGGPVIEAFNKNSDFSLDEASVVSPTAQIGRRAIIKNSVLLSGAVVADAETLNHVIRGLGLDCKFTA